eukprot:scaffold223_cov96-Skeletonema_dohrnii-CCMP3373.AAC.9
MSMLQVIQAGSTTASSLKDFSIPPTAVALVLQEQGTIETQASKQEEEVDFQERNRSKRRGSKLNQSSSSKKENKVIEILDDDDGQISRNFCDGYGQEITAIA